MRRTDLKDVSKLKQSSVLPGNTATTCLGEGREPDFPPPRMGVVGLFVAAWSVRAQAQGASPAPSRLSTRSALSARACASCETALQSLVFLYLSNNSAQMRCSVNSSANEQVIWSSSSLDSPLSPTWFISSEVRGKAIVNIVILSLCSLCVASNRSNSMMFQRLREWLHSSSTALIASLSFYIS